MYEPVHLHKNKLDRNFNVILLLIPIMVFVLTLAVIISRNHGEKHVATTKEQTSVLGDGIELLDNGDVNLSK